MAAVRFAPQHGREQADHRRPFDRRSLMIPGAVAGDAHAGLAATVRIPLVDRRQSALVDQLLQLGEADSLKLDRRTALRHGGSLDCFAPPLKAGVFAMTSRTEIIPGAGKRNALEVAL